MNPTIFNTPQIGQGRKNKYKSKKKSKNKNQKKKKKKKQKKELKNYLIKNNITNRKFKCMIIIIKKINNTICLKNSIKTYYIFLFFDNPSFDLDYIYKQVFHLNIDIPTSIYLLFFL